MNVSDGVALLTGGVSGIGEQIARHFVAGGGRVFIVDVRRDAAERIAGELGAAVPIFARSEE
jgi:NAD(P)-dependent dehydrogenase (short-subunit alcohol dehydrogenase family)